MIDKSIPYKNIIMRSDDNHSLMEPRLPLCYRFRDYSNGDDREWARLEVAINDFDTYDNAVRYFNKKYMSNLALLKERLICIENECGGVAGMVIAWKEYSEGKEISTVHWLVTSPEEQGKGIGTALVAKMLMKFREYNGFPIYLHTQPWSYKAIGIYVKSGFRILKNDTILSYENQYADAVKILSNLLDEKTYKKMIAEAI